MLYNFCFFLKISAIFNRKLQLIKINITKTKELLTSLNRYISNSPYIDSLMSILKTLSALVTLTFVISNCGLLSDRPRLTPVTQDTTEEVTNTMTVHLHNESILFHGNASFKHSFVEATPDIPAHSILALGSDNGRSSISLKVYENGRLINKGTFSGASSQFSLDKLVHINIIHDNIRYGSLVWGKGAGGTTLYYDSFLTITELRLIPTGHPAEKKVTKIKGFFSGNLKKGSTNIGTGIVNVRGDFNFEL